MTIWSQTDVLDKQNELKKHEKLECYWGMEFNLDKSKVLRITPKKSKVYILTLSTEFTRALLKWGNKCVERAIDRVRHFSQ